MINYLLWSAKPETLLVCTPWKKSPKKTKTPFRCTKIKGEDTAWERFKRHQDQLHTTNSRRKSKKLTTHSRYWPIKSSPAEKRRREQSHTNCRFLTRVTIIKTLGCSSASETKPLAISATATKEFIPRQVWNLLSSPSKRIELKGRTLGETSNWTNQAFYLSWGLELVPKSALNYIVTSRRV